MLRVQGAPVPTLAPDLQTDNLGRLVQSVVRQRSRIRVLREFLGSINRGPQIDRNILYCFCIETPLDVMNRSLGPKKRFSKLRVPWLGNSITDCSILGVYIAIPPLW